MFNVASHNSLCGETVLSIFLPEHSCAEELVEWHYMFEKRLFPYSFSSSIIYFCAYFLEKAMAPHSSTLAWKIPWMEESGVLQSMRSLRVRRDWATSLSLSHIGEGNGNPVQCSCLENPRDGCCLWSDRVGHDWSGIAAAATLLIFNAVRCTYF